MFKCQIEDLYIFVTDNELDSTDSKVHKTFGSFKLSDIQEIRL